jgi:hypothetical protein
MISDQCPSETWTVGSSLDFFMLAEIGTGPFVPFSSQLSERRFPSEQHLGEGCLGERSMTH